MIEYCSFAYVSDPWNILDWVRLAVHGMACWLLITAINQPAPAFERLVKTDTGELGSAHRGWDIDVSKWAHDSQSIEHDPPPLITLEDLKHLIHAIHTMQYLLRGIDTLSHILQHKYPCFGVSC